MKVRKPRKRSHFIYHRQKLKPLKNPLTQLANRKPNSRGKKSKMGTPETSRETCLYSILDNIDCVFGMGAVRGSAFHFIKGVYNSPTGSCFLDGS
ncbi:hypothetical protein CRYUN_Cryun33cG0058600 [Craigia yunnanensis]